MTRHFFSPTENKTATCSTRFHTCKNFCTSHPLSLLEEPQSWYSAYSIFVLFRYWQVKKLCPKCEYQWSDDISSTMFNLRKVGNESIFYFSITLALGPGEGTARCHDKLTWFIQKCTQCRPTNALHWKFSGLIKWRIFLNLKVTSQLGYEFFDVFCHSAVNNLE